MSTFVCNYLPTDVVSREHICYYTERHEGLTDIINLYEVNKVKIRHPEFPGLMTLESVETHLVDQYLRNARDSDKLVLLEIAQDNVRKHNVAVK